MTEKEIVEYLKNNRTKGVAFGFMPEEVKEWCKNNSCKLIYYQPNDLWNRNSAKEYLFVSNEIVALPEDFDLVPKSEGGWVEFEIDENGCFRFLYTDMRFHWSEWNKPLWFYEKDENRSWYLTAFGGWQYKDSDSWYMTPQIESFNAYSCFSTSKDEIPPKPAIPTKIRFWREAK